ncbi:hypothetical protein C8F04DRAFT_950048 [Mycena alexandri]|uniref:Uncharacterized protein n=1 Tax=Mycena alexandri TaxID=1745969 RepID=A0AAD6X7B5_9AGAR|nr:hypothetical protein C8F04DRAFT_950048 [Mycena alexandri]
MRGKSCLFLLFLSLPAAIAALVTTILDDAFAGDSQSSITYSPSNVWVVGSSTNHGRISPDPTQAFDSTWHDATDDTTPNHDGTTPLFMEVNFQGTGIDIRCIIANNLADPSIPSFTGTKANYSFFMDNVPQNKDFLHEAGTTGDAFLYNTSVFATNGLSAASHTLKLLLNGGPEVDGSVLLLFDYAIVTYVLRCLVIRCLRLYTGPAMSRPVLKLPLPSVGQNQLPCRRQQTLKLTRALHRRLLPQPLLARYQQTQ